MALWITMEEARQLLGVRPQTIYAYVSRGQIGACPDQLDPRRSLYRKEDVLALAKKKQTGRKRETLAVNTIFGGEPSIPTAISTFSAGRLYYRGKDVVSLAETATLEDVATLLWDSSHALVFPCRERLFPEITSARSCAFVSLASAVATGHSTHGRTSKVLYDEATSLVASLAASFGAAAEPGMLLHERLALGWKQPQQVAELLRKTMVLLADHELTSSSFAARIAASTGASLSACLLAGLTTFSGPLHGDASGRVRLLFDEIGRVEPDRLIDRYLSAAIPIPGFGHNLYPDGDPRAVALIDSFDLPDTIARFIEKVVALTGVQPNIDAALAALAARFCFPDDGAFALFSIARGVGLLAHSMEQLSIGMVIRPRGRYTGPALERVPGSLPVAVRKPAAT
jgi:citrate synthase